jgi:hypothetical protein
MRIQNIGIFLFFLWIGFSMFLGERIPANNGLGWDGAGYALIAQKLDFMIKNHSLSIYVTQRIFPSFIIFSFSKLFDFSITNQNAPLLFSVLNGTMLIISFYILNALAKKFKWSPQVKIISFAGLFLNFANLKMIFYYPILTDTTAFTLCLGMLYCYFNRKNLALLVLALIGAWTFPTLLYVGMILFLFPIKANEKTNSEITASKNSGQYNPIVGFIFAILLTAACTLVAYNHPYPNTLGKNDTIFWLSCLCLFAYLFSAFKYYSYSRVKSFLSFIKPARVLLVLCIFIGVRQLILLVSGTEEGALNSLLYFNYISNGALAYPLNFIISHTLYYGAAVVLFIYYWKETIEYIYQKGPGLFLVTLLYLILSIGSESRQLINFLPFVVVLVAEVLNKKTISWNFVIFFTLLNLAISRFWLPLNHGDWPILETSPPQLTLEFPLQWYFMNQGPWVSPAMYWITASIAILIFTCIHIAVKRKKLIF